MQTLISIKISSRWKYELSNDVIVFKHEVKNTSYLRRQFVERVQNAAMWSLYRASDEWSSNMTVILIAGVHRHELRQTKNNWSLSIFS